MNILDKKLLDFYNDINCSFVFGKYIFYPKDLWRRHLHIKMNNSCFMDCNFCIEKNNTCKVFHDDFYYKKLDFIIKELIQNNIIKTISVTGGEPFLDIDRLCKILEIINKYKFELININSNGYEIYKYQKEINKYKIDFINISRHHYNDVKNNEIFKTDKVFIFPEKLNCKIRFQCVCLKDFINNKNEIEKYIKIYYKKVFDFSFRQLIKPYEKLEKEKFNYFLENNISLKPIYKEFLVDKKYKMNFIHNDEYEYYVEFKDTEKNKSFVMCYTDMN
ncbi:MAG TPA: radical SAM protein, partial [Candidatus Lokiarchaeia archaeon]